MPGVVKEGEQSWTRNQERPRYCIVSVNLEQYRYPLYTFQLGLAISFPTRSGILRQMFVFFFFQLDITDLAFIKFVI